MNRLRQVAADRDKVIADDAEKVRLKEAAAEPVTEDVSAAE